MSLRKSNYLGCVVEKDVLEKNLECGVESAFDVRIGRGLQNLLKADCAKVILMMPTFGCESNDVTCSAMIDVDGLAMHATPMYIAATGINRPIALVEANVVPSQISLFCEIAGAPLFGTLHSKFDPMTCWKSAAGLMLCPLPVVVFITWLTNKEMKQKWMGLNVVLYNTLLAMCADPGYKVGAVKKLNEELKTNEHDLPPIVIVDEIGKHVGPSGWGCSGYIQFPSRPYGQNC